MRVPSCVPSLPPLERCEPVPPRYGGAGRRSSGPALDRAQRQHRSALSASTVPFGARAQENGRTMRDWRLEPLPAAAFGLTVAVELAAVLLSWGLEPRYDTLLYAVYSVTLAGSGALIASRHPENAIGWLFCGFALLNAVTADLAQGYGLRAAEQGWPAGAAGEGVFPTGWRPRGVGLTLNVLAFPPR